MQKEKNDNKYGSYDLCKIRDFSEDGCTKCYFDTK